MLIEVGASCTQPIMWSPLSSWTILHVRLCLRSKIRERKSDFFELLSAEIIPVHGVAIADLVFVLYNGTLISSIIGNLALLLVRQKG